jgi:hypothetical protein
LIATDSPQRLHGFCEESKKKGKYKKLNGSTYR